jgi:phosphotransferase system HPr (HPr) family protein
VALVNKSGLHARPAKVFARAAASHSCDISVSKGDREANAKSVLSVLTLDCLMGDEITIRTEGDGAERALHELAALVEAGLGEPEASG